MKVTYAPSVIFYLEMIESRIRHMGNLATVVGNHDMAERLAEEANYVKSCANLVNQCTFEVNANGFEVDYSKLEGEAA